MPNYDFECSVCGLRFETFAPVDERWKVKHCGVQAKQLLSIPRIEVFRERYYNNLGSEPVWVSSKRQLKDEAKKRGLRVERS